MQRIKILIIISFFIFNINLNSQNKVSSKKVKPKSRIELAFQIGYSRPMMEAYGNNVTINSTEDIILIDGKRFLVSDNLGAESGYTVQTYFKYSFLKKGQLKGLFNLGYNIVSSSHPGPSDFTIGTRVQTFSVGIGTEINPIGHEKKIYPGLYGLLRMNLIGGETYHKAGLDFFKVTPRYGYTAGIKLNTNLTKTIGMYLGYSYSYDNLWSKQTEEETPNDVHVIVFRDKQSFTNGLTHDRRVVYWSLYLGMNFFFK